MTVELPKDAEGREITLDTETLYDKDGKEIEVSRYQYYPKVGPGYWNIRSERNKFYGQDEVYLTPPDSWEKLLDDLCEALEQGGRSGNPVCAYLAARGLCRGRMDEEGRCKLSDASLCANGMVSNIRGRIKRLCAGEVE